MSGLPSNIHTFLIYELFTNLAWHLWICLGSLIVWILYVAFFSWWVTHCSFLLITCASKQQKHCFYSWIGSLSLLQARNNYFQNKQQISDRFFQAGSGILNNSRLPKFLSFPSPENPNPLTFPLISQYFPCSLQFGFYLVLIKTISWTSLEMHENHQPRQGLTGLPERARKQILNAL